MTFVLSYWDYVLEAVGYICVSIFDSLLKLHFCSCRVCRKSSCDWVQDLHKFLFGSPVRCNAHLRCMVRSFWFFVRVYESNLGLKIWFHESNSNFKLEM